MEATELNELTHAIIGCAIKVHTAIGPGLLESAYEKCLTYELVQAGYVVERQVILPLVYDGLLIDAGYRLDLRVDNKVIVEVKAVDKVLPVHHAQLLSYMKLSGLHLALLINFNVVRLVDGVKRFILA
jgi:GxxExxY protein